MSECSAEQCDNAVTLDEWGRRDGLCPLHAARVDREGGQHVPRGFLTGHEMARKAGVTYRQLDWWASHEYVPSGRKSPGSGVFRLYGPESQDVVCAAAALVRQGFRPASLAAHDGPTILRLHAAVEAAVAGTESQRGDSTVGGR